MLPRARVAAPAYHVESRGVRVERMLAFLSELRRRRVIRALVGWGVFAFAVLGVFEPIMHGLALPEWTLGLAVVILAAGFPATVVLAWIFDLGPGGVERTAEAATAAAEPARSTRRGRTALGLMAVGIIAAAPGLAWYFVMRRPEPAAAPGASAETAPSVAVLPLVNLSGDVKQAYFSDGMTEEITAKLARVRGLLVAARTSAARYRESPRSAREIGVELGVAYLVEGSVRRAGERIRVNTALVRTADGVQIWSDGVDATLDDIFEVQSHVAARVVEALGVELKPGERSALDDWGTRNAHAYDIFLKARERMAVGLEDQAVSRQATDLLEQALRIDPDFAPALGALAAVLAHVYRDFDSSPALLERAESLAGRALALDPKLTTALTAAASVRSMRFDYAGGAALYRRVVAETPTDHDAWDKLCWSLGYAIPPSLDEAEVACRRALALQPSFYPSHYHLLRLHVLQGRLDLAEQDIAHLRAIAPDNPLVFAGRFWLAMANGKPRDALDALSTRGSDTNLDVAWRAMAHAQLGELDAAFAQLDAALSDGYRDVNDLRTNRYWEPLRRDARWASTLARHGIKP